MKPLKFEELNLKSKKALARIHAHICGDGWLKDIIVKRSPASERTSWDKDNHYKVYSIEYYNNEKNPSR